MSKAFFAGFAVAASLAAAGWFLRVAPEREAADRRTRDADESARRARREAADAQQWAETERNRNRLLDDKVRELERLLTTTAPPAPAGPVKEGPPETPEQWDRARLNQEFENLRLAGVTAGQHQRYPLVVRAMRARRDESAELLAQILRGGFDSTYAATAATLAIGLGDGRIVAPLLERWEKETDLQAQAAILRALANLPGDGQVEFLVRAWSAPKAVAQHRMLALHGLALRGHEIARGLAKDRGADSAEMRVRAIESLVACAARGEWKDPSLIPLFGAVLRTADGPAQRKLSLIALEGFWSKECVPDVRAFADDPASPPELVLRARRLIEGVEAGAPRPAGAGIPERGLVPGAPDMAPPVVPDSPK